MTAVFPASARAVPAAQTVVPESTIERTDFERVRTLIRERAGIHLHAGKQAMVYSRLSRRLRELGHATFGDYLRRLEQARGAQGEREWQEFVNCLTTNLTSFFREEHHFEALAAFLRERRPSRLRIWCNAASTGEEPYSIAMTVLENGDRGADVRILCSDINTKVLATAANGVYPADARGLDPGRLRRHFLRGTGANRGLARVGAEVRRLVEFRVLNLAEENWRLPEHMDIVFCRNVLIYFDPPMQRRVLERMHAAMHPGALLFAGHSENLADSRDLFVALGKTMYERVR